MKWPFGKSEKRADSSYTDALVAAITANAGNQSTAFPYATGALESVAGLVGRAFAACEVSAPEHLSQVLTPAFLSMVGRALIRRGEAVFYIDVNEVGEIALLPCESHDVDGNPDPASWRYRCSVAGPERTRTYSRVEQAGVVHLCYARDVETPWRGYGPLQVALLAGRLSAETVKSLADESSGPRGAFLPLPMDGDDPTLALLKSDIRGAAGKVLLTEGGDFDKATGDNTNWMVRRFGASPPDSLVKLATLATGEVLAACGASETLFGGGDGTAKRESYRQFLFGTLAPLGRLVSSELSMKLEADVTLDWTELRASDVAGRARAFQSLVGGGMDMAQAAQVSGVLVDD